MAGSRAVSCRAAGNVTERKSDGSPVTRGDREAQEIIIKGLQDLTPGVPIIAEEKENPHSLTDLGTYWLVDPLDGTCEYVKGRDEFSVNIGLVYNDEPIIGAIYAPVMDDLFYGDPTGAVRTNQDGTFNLRPTSISDYRSFTGLRLITSRREADRLPLKQWLESGQISSWSICSSAYKFGLLAAGEHDIFVRTGLTYEWDTAAGDAILRAVGGRTTTPDGKDLVYGKFDFRNDALIAYNKGAENSIFALELGQRLLKLAA